MRFGRVKYFKHRELSYWLFTDGCYQRQVWFKISIWLPYFSVNIFRLQFGIGFK